MVNHLVRGVVTSRARWRRLLSRATRVAWDVLRALLLAGAAMGPSAPPPPPPPPQTVEAKAEDRSAEQDD